jgi:hypothetical protein
MSNIKKLTEELEKALREAKGEEPTFAHKLNEATNKRKAKSKYDPNEPFTYQSKEDFYSDDYDDDQLFVYYDTEDGFHATGELTVAYGKSFDELVQNVISEVSTGDAVEFELEYEPDGNFDPKATEEVDVGSILVTYYYSDDSDDEDDDYDDDEDDDYDDDDDYDYDEDDEDYDDEDYDDEDED